MKKQGTHGTCLTCYFNIKAQGFKIKSGMTGKGAYFWRQCPYSDDFATGWYRYYLSLGKYRAAAKKEGVIIHVNLECKEDEYLDLEAAAVKDLVMALARKLGMKKQKKEEIAEIYDLVVSQLEAANKISYKLLQARVGLPQCKWFDFYDMKLGAPICFIARTNDIIKIQKMVKMHG